MGVVKLLSINFSYNFGKNKNYNTDSHWNLEGEITAEYGGGGDRGGGS